jgi:hypothetical protein
MSFLAPCCRNRAHMPVWLGFDDSVGVGRFSALVAGRRADRGGTPALLVLPNSAASLGHSLDTSALCLVAGIPPVGALERAQGWDYHTNGGFEALFMRQGHCFACPGPGRLGEESRAITGPGLPMVR